MFGDITDKENDAQDSIAPIIQTGLDYFYKYQQK